LNLKTILDFDDNNDCEVDEEEEDGNENENDEEAIDILPYCSNAQRYQLASYSREKRWRLCSASVAFTLIT
ncbi:unnamed protein product, partial [Rotaria magnacalcarata]